MDDTLDIRQLRAFAAVMSVGSITGAAKLLGLSQPSVTRLIQQLETELGFTLLHRNGPRIVPTDQGAIFHEDVERLLGGLRNLRTAADTIRNGSESALSIVATSALATGLVPYALGRIPEGMRPPIVEIRSGGVVQVVQSVLARSADIGVASLPIDYAGLQLHWIGEAPCVAAVRKDDPLASRDTLAIADLAGRQVITMANPFRMRSAIDRAIHRAAVAPKRIIDTNVSSAALGAARAGLGIAIVEPVSAYGQPIEGVSILRLDVSIPFFWGVVTPVVQTLPEAVTGLIDVLAEAAAAMLPGFRKHSGSQRELLTAALDG